MVLTRDQLGIAVDGVMTAVGEFEFECECGLEEVVVEVELVVEEVENPMADKRGVILSSNEEDWGGDGDEDGVEGAAKEGMVVY